MLTACDSPTETGNLAALDAMLTNGAGVDPEVLAAAGGRIEKAPAAIASKDAAPGAATLGALAGQQAAQDNGASQNPGRGDCTRSIKYGSQWAERMPEPFRLYPRGTLTEAAGTDKAPCNKLRVISFTTPASIDQVMDYYYTQAKRAGYDAEHLLSDGEHQLGGTRGEAAYVVFARAGKSAATEVDVIANVN